MLPDSDPDSSDELACEQGRQAAARFPSPHQQYAIVEVANVASTRHFTALSTMIGGDLASKLDKARRRRPFDSVADVACALDTTPGHALGALDLFKDLARRACAFSTSGQVPFAATPRMCSEQTISCGQPTQPSCLAPAGTYVRPLPKVDDPFPMLPSEVTFGAGRYAARYSDGRTADGPAQVHQIDLRTPDRAVFFYLSLQLHGGQLDDVGYFHLEMTSENRLRLNPMIGPVGREIAAPAFNKEPP